VTGRPEPVAAAQDLVERSGLVRRAQIVLAVLVIGVGLGTAPAMAASVKPGSQVSAELPHCVVSAMEVNKAGPVAAPRCFRTFAAAVAAATNGRVKLPPDATTVDEATLNSGPESPNSTSATVIGIEYEHKYFAGWSYIIQSTNQHGCYGYSYRIPSLPSNRNNEISSALTYNGCKSSHYSGTNLTGSRYLCGCSQMGSMNDQTSSIFFSRTGYLS
jgi:hypothetical protein